MFVGRVICVFMYVCWCGISLCMCVGGVICVFTYVCWCGISVLVG